ncbi:MAG: inner membrane CreD family protein, partial [Spirochaetales bacterium]|nr:inner membrane CreD family protein [Spirochaetales bacterium]
MKKIQLSNFTIKIALIIALFLLFLIPIGMIRHLIVDRKIYQKEAIRSITEPFGGKAEIQGLSIAVPYMKYTETYSSTGSKIISSEKKYILFAPDIYNMDMNVNPEYLTRGIFKVPVFNGSISLNAEFDSFDFSYFSIPDKDVLPNEAVLILGLSNTKNLTKQPALEMNGHKLTVSPIKY